MTTYVALLAAINVGGTSSLPMKDLAALGAGLGFTDVRTYIQSGNVVFGSGLSEAAVRERLEAALAERMGKAVPVMVRTAAEMRAVLEGNPFVGADGAKVVVVFRHDRLAKGAVDGVVGPDGEAVRAGVREVYVHYPNGMGRSKLKLPKLGAATGRNMNTVAKLVAMSGG